MNLDYAQLVALAPDILGTEGVDEIELNRDICTIGRSVECHIVVRREDVSRLHARIERDGHRYLLVDSDSANGTFVNGKPISKPYLLRNRDEIGLGDATSLLRFLDPDPTVETRSKLRYDDDRMAFVLNGQELPLTPSEQRLLYHLYRHKGVICHHDSCATAIWGEDFEPGRDSRLDGVFRDLRKKLREVTAGADELIVTHRGKGYELTA